MFNPDGGEFERSGNGLRVLGLGAGTKPLEQQLAIGRAMIGDPRLMLLDEPSEGIQPSIVKDIARNVLTLNEQTGVAVLLVEQNLDLIVSLAQRGFVMEKGRIVASLNREEITSRAVVRRYLTI